MKTDRQELITLRVSVARVAQAMSVDDLPNLRFRGKDYNELLLLATFQDRGWNALCASIADRGQEFQNEIISVRETLGDH